MEIPQSLASWPISLDPVEEGRRLEYRPTGSEVRDLAHGAALRFGRTFGYRLVLDQVLAGSTARSDHKRATTAPWFAGPSTASFIPWSTFDTASSVRWPCSYEVVATERSWTLDIF